MTPDEISALADEIEQSDGLVVIRSADHIQLGIKKTAAVIAMLRDRRKYSLLESQFENCHKEIRKLRDALIQEPPKCAGLDSDLPRS